MWFLRRRRRRAAPPVLQPSLDRLSERVGRVVAELDELVLNQHNLYPEPAKPPDHTEREELVLVQHKPSAAGWVAVAGLPGGYRLVQREGAPPARGAAVELDGTPFRVLRCGPSPLPDDPRPCAFLVREEPPRADRTLDR
jgi:hypothetical protein